MTDKDEWRARYWSFHDADGNIHPKTVYGPSLEFAQANAPPGHAPIEGAHDHRTKRVASGQVVERTSPPSPSVAERRAEAMREIYGLEHKTGPRAVREALLELLPPDSPARERLARVDSAIAALRKELR